MKVTFCGMGRMGRLMASHFLDAGHDLTIWNRTPGKADELRDRGAREATSVADAVSGADAVVLMLFGGDSVSEVLREMSGAATEGTLVIDSTTTGPRAARQLAAQAAESGLRYIDAPVAGSLAPAKEGSLTIFVGGADGDVAEARPLLELYGAPDRIRHLGPAGAGNALKTVVNMTLGVAMAGVGEALRLGADLELDRTLLLDALEAGPFGFSVKQKRQMLEGDDFGQTAFSLDLMAKDLTVAVDNATSELPLTTDALAAARAAAAAGHGDEDYAAMAGFRAATEKLPPA